VKRTLIFAAMGALMVAAGLVFVRTIAEPPEHFPSWAERGLPPPEHRILLPQVGGFPTPTGPPPPTSYTVCGIAGAENCWETAGRPMR
jgi:hypothetical protein